MTTFRGSKIKAARDAKGLTQKELADRLGKRQEAISRLEHGQQPRSETLAKIAAELDVSIDSFFTAEEQA